MAALLGTTHARHDTVGAELVASDHDPHEGLIRSGTHRGITQRIEAFVATPDSFPAASFATEADFDLLACTRFDPGDQIGKLMQLTGAENGIGIGCPVENQ